jgi:hypothetical protein
VFGVSKELSGYRRNWHVGMQGKVVIFYLFNIFVKNIP